MGQTLCAECYSHSVTCLSAGVEFARFVLCLQSLYWCRESCPCDSSWVSGSHACLQATQSRRIFVQGPLPPFKRSSRSIRGFGNGGDDAAHGMLLTVMLPGYGVLATEFIGSRGE